MGVRVPDSRDSKKEQEARPGGRIMEREGHGVGDLCAGGSTLTGSPTRSPARAPGAP